MDNERLFNLCVELIERMDVAHKEAQLINMREGDSDFFFVHDGDREFVNPKRLSFAKHCEINQLSQFVRYHKDINEEILQTLLNMNKTKFQFLLEVKSVVPNLVEEMRNHDDEKYISYLYATYKMYPNTENNLRC